MNSKQAVLTALGCAGSLAAMLSVARPAVAAATTDADGTLPALTQAESNPITDTQRCSCARCMLGEMSPSL